MKRRHLFLATLVATFCCVFAAIFFAMVVAKKRTEWKAVYFIAIFVTAMIFPLAGKIANFIVFILKNED